MKFRRKGGFGEEEKGGLKAKKKYGCSDCGFPATFLAPCENCGRKLCQKCYTNHLEAAQCSGEAQ
ncbi:MAG: hypothetical protein ACFFBD_04450 [Candidatus Hodarchaeota archaeon]